MRLPCSRTEASSTRATTPRWTSCGTSSHGGKGYLATLEAKLKEETGIRTLKIGYNRVFGYYIEVSRSFSNQVPANFVRKQTLANAERYITAGSEGTGE